MALLALTVTGLAAPRPIRVRFLGHESQHHDAACFNCHMLGGKGGTVGPALAGIAARKGAAYLKQTLLEPNAKLAEGFEKLGVSPMPPLNLILKPPELADVEAFILGRK